MAVFYGIMMDMTAKNDHRPEQICNAGLAADCAVRCGIDLIRIERMRMAILRHGDRLLDRLFDPEERQACPGPKPWLGLAARFAAKEAVGKALGTGIGPAGVGWRDIVTLTDKPYGEPRVRLSGGAERRFREIGGLSIAISLTHDGPMAGAMCTVLCRPPK